MMGEAEIFINYCLCDFCWKEGPHGESEQEARDKAEAAGWRLCEVMRCQDCLDKPIDERG